MAQKKIFEFARSITESDKNDQASIYLDTIGKLYVGKTLSFYRRFEFIRLIFVIEKIEVNKHLK